MVKDLDSLIKQLTQLREEHGNVEVEMAYVTEDNCIEYEKIQFVSHEYSNKVVLFGEEVVK